MTQAHRQEPNEALTTLAVFAAFAQNHPDGVMVLRETGEVCFLNAAAAIYLQCEPAQLEDVKFEVDLRPGELVTTHLPDHAGGERVVEIESSEILWQGRPALLATLRPTSPARRLETPVDYQTELRDRFLAMLSHELRNPLSAIVNASVIIQRGQKTPPVDLDAIQQAAAVVLRQSQQLSRLLDDLLDVARVTLGKIELRRERLTLANVVCDAGESVQPLIRQHGHQFAISIKDDSCTVCGDPARLRQIVATLLSNAAKYTPSGGKIEAELRREGDFAAIYVRDNGVGLASDALEKIFEMFVQCDETLDRSQGGLGVGLTLVRELVQLHDGRVCAHSDGLGEGCEFSVFLPLAPREPLMPVLPSRSTESAKRLLLVEDIEDNRVMLCQLLKLSGYQVEAACDGAEALEKICEGSYDAVVLDIGLPKLSGYEVARRVRADGRFPDLRLIALTGYGQPSDRLASQQAGFNAHLVKPLNIERLTDLLNCENCPTADSIETSL